MAEYLDILDKQGNKTGEVAEYNEAHAKGLIHSAAHIWILNPKGELLLQKRSPNKKQYPNMWDISAAGHISAGQTSKEAALREIKEELGLVFKEEDLSLIARIQEDLILDNGAYANHEFDDVYLIRSDVDDKDIRFEDDEVTGIKWITIKELKRMAESQDPSLAPHGEEYKRLFEYLEEIQ